MGVPLTSVAFDPAQTAEGAALMGRSAANDPLFRYCLPDSLTRPTQVAAFMRTILRVCLTNGVVWTTPEPMTGVAAWLDPDHPSITPEDWHLAGWEDVAQAWGSDAVDRFQTFRADLSDVAPQLPHDPHWYLAWVCVDPEAQGLGIGRILITTPPRPGAGALPWHLRTIAARNVPLYDYLGFNIVHETQLPRSGLPHWYMMRPAHTDTALV